MMHGREMEHNVSQEEATMSRSEDRHSHIGIRLHCQLDDKWERVEALGWNVAGFNFMHAREMVRPMLALRRGLTRFEGLVIWARPNTNDEVVAEAITNELIFKRARHAQPELRSRLIKLIRVSGMREEKTQVLATLGVAISDDLMAGLVAKRKREHPLIHYGVQVQSDAWRAIVDETLNVSSVIVAMEKWSSAFVKP